jgi:hypothetical protein
MNELQAKLRALSAKRSSSWKGDFFVNVVDGLCIDSSIHDVDFSSVEYNIMTFPNGNWMCVIEEKTIPQGFKKSYDQGIGDYITQI